ncbi:unnamed protein product [Clonostachys rhizophaga]|uniref:Uncharacterized protein n=1 Tax=Clonostachys rhizophaga TaxID=160324 RepID=A0A9N9YQ80_9HYPO|nr:unnamed protein product [Clonostachys rhizophaga]
MSKAASNKKPSESYWRGSVGDEISNFTLLLPSCHLPPCLDGLGSPATSVPFTDAHQQESVIPLYPLAATGESIFYEFWTSSWRRILSGGCSAQA